ncbi:MAG TPA: hypothetical protein VIG51_00175 [Candidatus Baltobacteraceae bacterium]|jgi:hypothetical protein
MNRLLASSLCCAVALGACSSQQGRQANNAAPSPAPSIANPIAFPLYANARVLSTKAYTQTVNTAGTATSASALSEGGGTYSGHEVVAATPSSFVQLTDWVHALDAKPPQGYTTAPAVDLNQARAQAKRFGLDFAAFQTQQNGKKVGLLVVVMDPARVTTKLGPVLDLIGKYRMLPGAMRSGIDSQVKSRTGMSVTEAMQPDSPIGAALSALDEFQHSNQRGILLIDATKQ